MSINAPILDAKPVSAMSSGVTLRVETAADALDADRLVEKAFGPGRFSKTAERLREQNHKLDEYSFCAIEGGRVVGSVRLWPILIGGERAVFLGPIAVDATCRSRGLGADLVRIACKAATDGGERVILLVGEGSFFEPLGFQPVPRDRIALPGPVDMRRVFWMGLKPEALDTLSGAVAKP